MSPDTALMSPPGVGGDKKGKLPFFRKKHEKIHNNDQTLGDLKLYRAAFNAFVDDHDAGRRRELGVFLQTLEVTSQAPPTFPPNAPMGTGVVRCPYCRKRPALYELKGDGERVKCAKCIDAAANSYVFMPQRFAALLRLLEAAERGAPPPGAPDILQSVRIATDKTQLTRVRAILGTQVSHTRRATTSGGPRNRNPLHPSGHAPGTSQGVARARPGTMGGQPQPRQMIGNSARRFGQATPSGGYPRGSSNPASPPAASYVPTVARCALCQRGIGLLFSPSARGAVCSTCAHTRPDPQGMRAMPQCALEFARVYTAVVGALGVEYNAHNAKPLEQFLYHSNVETSQKFLDQLCDSHRVRRIPLCTKCGLRIPYFSGETKGGVMRRPKGFRCCLICFNTCYEGHFPMFDADAAQFFATLLRRVARAVAESPPGVAGAQENLNFLAALHVVMTFDTFCDIRARFAPAPSPPPPPPQKKKKKKRLSPPPPLQQRQQKTLRQRANPSSMSRIPAQTHRATSPRPPSPPSLSRGYVKCVRPRAKLLAQFAAAVCALQRLPVVAPRIEPAPQGVAFPFCAPCRTVAFALRLRFLSLDLNPQAPRDARYGATAELVLYAARVLLSPLTDADLAALKLQDVPDAARADAAFPCADFLAGRLRRSALNSSRELFNLLESHTARDGLSEDAADQRLCDGVRALNREMAGWAAEQVAALPLAGARIPFLAELYRDALRNRWADRTSDLTAEFHDRVRARLQREVPGAAAADIEDAAERCARSCVLFMAAHMQSEESYRPRFRDPEDRPFVLMPEWVTGAGEEVVPVVLLE